MTHDLLKQEKRVKLSLTTDARASGREKAFGGAHEGKGKERTLILKSSFFFFFFLV